MQFLKWIFELVVMYYIIKFVITLVSGFFVVKRVVDNTKRNASFDAQQNSNSQNNKPHFAEPVQKPIDIKDGEYITFEEIKDAK